MKKIGITGFIGSGKTYICSIFVGLGVKIYNSDKELKKLYDNPTILKDIENIVGCNLTINNVFAPKLLSDIVFNNETLMEKVSSYLFPFIKNDYDNFCEENKNDKYTIFESALIYQYNLESLFDGIIYVNCDKNLSIERAIKRDSTTKDEIIKRFDIQEKRLKNRPIPSYIINNDAINENDNYLNRLLVQEILKIHDHIQYTNYVLGFLFNEDKTKVLLIKKNRPLWQKDLLNGIGGKIEYNENPHDAMVREFKEECGIDIIDWNYVGKVGDKSFNNKWTLNLFHQTVTNEIFNTFKSVTDEIIDSYLINDVNYLNINPNLKYLIPICLDDTINSIDIEYQ